MTNLKKEGFSLIEIIVSMGLLATVMVVISSLLISNLRGSRMSSAINLVQNQGAETIQSITQMLRFAKSVPSCDHNGMWISFTAADNQPAFYTLDTSVGRLASGSATRYITSDKLTASGCMSGKMFVCTNNLVDICLGLEYIGSGDVTEETNQIQFKTSVIVR